MSENKIPSVSYNGNVKKINLNFSPFSEGNISPTKEETFSKENYMGSSLDPDEQFVLDIIRNTKKESISEMIDILRSQESKSVLLVRILERYQLALEGKGDKAE
jgi:hypothetical protein